jgi:hypothetical protein
VHRAQKVSGAAHLGLLIAFRGCAAAAAFSQVSVSLSRPAKYQAVVVGGGVESSWVFML